MIDWAAYLKEREGYSTYETEKLFVTYTKVSDSVFYVRDCYVKPEFRGNHEVLKAQDDFEVYMRDLGATNLRGTVSFGLSGTTQSIKMMLGLGYKPTGVNSLQQLVFEKEI